MFLAGEYNKMMKTIRSLINENKDNNIAITSDDSQEIKFSDLKQHIFNISGQLSANGISNKDRAAIVLPNGPEMATAFYLFLVICLLLH